MAQDEAPRERVARYRRLMEAINDERAIKALAELCEELENRIQPGGRPRARTRGDGAA